MLDRTSSSSSGVPSIQVSESKTPLADQSLLTVQDVVERPASAGIASSIKLSLEVLKDVLEAVDTLPCVKYIAGVGIKILETADVRVLCSANLEGAVERSGGFIECTIQQGIHQSDRSARE